MKWSDKELEELAAFFAKRLTPGLQPLDPTDPPPPASAETEWLSALKSARSGGMLPTLARQIGRVCPEDENLQQACSLLFEGQGISPSALMGAALSVGMAFLIAGAGVYAFSPPVQRVIDLQPESVVAMAPQFEAKVVAEPMALPVAKEVVEDVPTVDVPVATAKVRFERCTAGEGEVVGYWYAGHERPGTLGSTVTLTHAINVRADYPDVHNRFDARSKVTCVLQEGDLVRLSRTPVKVPGDAYWVPLVTGDLTG